MQNCLPFRLAALAVILVSVFNAKPWAQPVAAPLAPAALPVVTVGPTAQPLPANRWTAQQIRQAFELADSDGNGELSRAEAQRLPIVPHSFEEMDQNKDGVISRSEYEAAFTR